MTISLLGSIKFHIILTLTTSHTAVAPRGDSASAPGLPNRELGAILDVCVKVLTCDYSTSVPVE